MKTASRGAAGHRGVGSPLHASPWGSGDGRIGAVRERLASGSQARSSHWGGASVRKAAAAAGAYRQVVRIVLGAVV